MKGKTFFDFHVSNNAVSMLKQCGYSGCVVFEEIAPTGKKDSADASASDTPINAPENISRGIDTCIGTDISISNGIEIHAKNANALRKLVDSANRRSEIDIVAVYGGNETINRAACKDSNVDVLVHPETEKDGGINHVIAKEARDHGVAIEFDLSRIIFLRGASRIKAISDFRVNLMLARKYEVDILLVSNAKTPYDVRMPQEMVALAGLFGMHQDEAYRAMCDVPHRIFKEKAPGYITSGVEIVE